MDRVWVRAVVALTTYLGYAVAMFALGGSLVDHGYSFGTGLIYFNALCLFAAVMLLPAWVIKRPEPPPGGGRPRETVVAFPAPDDVVDAEEPPRAA